MGACDSLWAVAAICHVTVAGLRRVGEVQGSTLVVWRSPGLPQCLPPQHTTAFGSEAV